MFASMTYDFVNQTQTSSPTEYASAPTLQLYITNQQQIMD